MNANLTLNSKELKNYEDILLNENMLFELNAIPQMIVNKNRIIIRVNKKFIQLFGYRKDEILGKQTVVLTPTKEKFIEYAKHFVETKDGIIKSEELEYKKKDNSLFWVKLEGNPINQQNDELFVLWSFIDITKEVNFRKELEAAKLLAEEATKSKSDFLANMSHEIRTPMNGIIGMTHLVKQTLLNEKQKHFINIIDSSANSLLSIINDILDFSKIEAGKLDIDKIDFNLNELILNVSNIVDYKAKEKGLLFEFIYDNNLPIYLNGDSLRISQILINLINNAIKFTEKGYVKVFISSENNHFKFEVQDSGIGMSSLQQNNLFKSFSQADASTTRKYGGTGLGLSISKQLVELMDGEIWVKSEEKQGSTFGFYLMLHKAKNNISNKINKEVTIDDLKVLKGSTILLTEDNPINQEIIFGLLENSGINIDIASNGLEALTKYNNQKEKYELIFMDLQMPVMGGLEATTLIRDTKDGKTIPIIALTANAMKEDIVKTKKVGMNDHLNKPIEVEKLYKVLLKYISKKVDRENIEDINISEKVELNIPILYKIDTSIGLSKMANDKILYLSILNKFYLRYKDLNLTNFNSEDSKMIIHTMKGLSGNIGANDLYKILKIIDDAYDIRLLDKFHIELKYVLDELKNITVEKSSDSGVYIVCNKEIKQQFSNLLLALKSKRPKNYNPIIEEIQKSKLDKKESILFHQVKELVSKYNLKQAIQILS